ncbi:TKL protein kinase [Fonticula alba]|uniref:TKL protein kinase n=1 Tax=Fonticula alba TaxID=691883 RepID=A0A058Z1H7_FONAL|nr:TKL protein kinase [Fonticula alba]KCV68134.1 TKL protein kinase [Fonticula alba]|eukprot:XP_009497508.1 TKL protein kinase [Fonticula alba]
MAGRAHLRPASRSVLLLLALLAAAMAALRPVLAQGIFYHETLLPFSWNMGPAVDLPLKPNHLVERVIFSNPMYLWSFHQSANMYSTLAEHRLGLYFSHGPSITRVLTPFQSSETPVSLRVSSSPNGPIPWVESSGTLAFWSDNNVWVPLVYSPANSLIGVYTPFAGHAAAFLRQPDGRVIFHVASPAWSSTAQVLVDVAPPGTAARMAIGHTTAAAWFDSSVYLARFSWDTGILAGQVGMLGFTSPVLDVAIGCTHAPGKDTLFALLASGWLYACRDYVPGMGCESAHEFVVPGLTGPLTQGALIVPQSADRLSCLNWLLLYSGSQLLRVGFRSDTGLLQEAIPVYLPNGAPSPKTLHFVKILHPQGSGIWALTDGQRVFQDSPSFNCAVDRTIVCDDDMSIRTTRGFLCAQGQALSPVVSAGLLCAGCADGYGVPGSGSWTASSICSTCAASHCAACVADRCLVCLASHVLVIDPSSGAGTCQPACPSGQHVDPAWPGSRRCMPDVPDVWPARVIWPATFQADIGPPPGDFVTLARTRLMLVGGALHLVAASVTGDAAPMYFLGLSQQDSPMWLSPSPGAGGNGSPPGLSFQPLDALKAHVHMATQYGEIGPVSATGSGAVVHFFSCTPNSSLSRGTLKCLDPDASPSSSCLATISSLGSISGDCQSIRVVDDRTLTVLLTNDQVLVFRLEDDGALTHVTIFGASAHPAAFPLFSDPSSSPGPAGPGWLLLARGGARTLLAPYTMFRSVDPRTFDAHPALDVLPALPDAGQMHPVKLPAAGAGWEAVLSGLRVDPSSGRQAWIAAHMPRGARAHGRTVNVPANVDVLGQLPAATGAFQVLAVSLSGQDTPAALILLTEEHIGVALLRCWHGLAADAACWLQPAAFTPLSIPADGLARSPLHFHLLRASSTQGGPSEPNAFLLSIPHMPIRWLTIGSGECTAAGFYGPDCSGLCAPACRHCFGPGPDQCHDCSFHLPSSPGACLEACPQGLTPDPVSGACECPEGCDLCQAITDPGPGSGTYICTACLPGFGLSADHNPRPECLPCHGTCSECERPDDMHACTGCPAGSYLHDGQCVGDCPAGTWPDADGPSCRACPSTCTRCLSASMCTVCASGHFLPNDGVCRACDPSCATCGEEDACSACMDGLVFLSPDPGTPSLCGSTCPPGEFPGPERCARCDSSCDLCAGGPTHCLVCAAGFRWGAAAPGPGKTGACVPCPAGCASCTGTGRCLACAGGLLLAEDGACLAACPAGTFSNGESCQPCDISCAACADGQPDRCTGCAAGLELVEVTSGAGTCVSGCPEGQYRAGVECLPCDAACATCNGPTDKDCWRCTELVLQNGVCVQECAARHLAVGGRCLPCHASCEACVGVRSTECTACPGGLLALPAGQTPGRCVPGCPVGHNTAPAGCALCASHCASCPESADTCALCERGFLLAGGACGTECPAGAAPQGGLCASCHGSCLTCYGPGPGHCLTCGPAAPLKVGGHCHATCPAGTFESEGTCLPCHGTCAACTGPSGAECSACPPDRVLTQDGTCSLDCPAGTYAQDGGSSGWVCASCDASCAACLGPLASECTACLPGRVLDGGACGETCSAGHFVCLASRRCEPCPAGCAECQEQGTCQAACTACEAGLLLSGTACMAACPAGHFAPAGSRICEPCDGACNTCTERPDRCTSCAAGFLLPAEGACASACPAGWAPLSTPDRVCLACPADCEECTAASGQAGCTVTDDGSLACPDIGSCSRCAAQFLLLHGASCVGTCPVGMPSSRGLALGLGIGLGLLMLLLLLVALLVLLWRYRRAAKSGGMDRMDDEDATVMNTIVELSLPGSILVSIANDFAPLDEQLGAGTQASVFAARAVGAGISDRLGCPGTVAIKQLKAERLTPTQVTLFQNEVALMWLLRGAPNIVRLYGYSEQPPAIVMERFDTDLATLLHSGVPLEQATILDIAQQWASGLEAMHAQGIAHRDLKPGNVFVSRRPDGSWTAALGDLGTSRNLNTDRSSTLVSQAPELNAMTARYAAPEVLATFHRKRPLDCELFLPADIYSAAIMLWERE